jgi:hypothetical protein
VPYEELKSADLVLTDLDGTIIEGAITALKLMFRAGDDGSNQSEVVYVTLRRSVSNTRNAGDEPQRGIFCVCRATVSPEPA